MRILSDIDEASKMLHQTENYSESTVISNDNAERTDHASTTYTNHNGTGLSRNDSTRDDTSKYDENHENTDNLYQYLLNASRRHPCYDTSGSITDEEFKHAFNDIKRILKNPQYSPFSWQYVDEPERRNTDYCGCSVLKNEYGISDDDLPTVLVIVTDSVAHPHVIG